MSETEFEGPDPNASLIAEDSTYEQIEPEEETNPPSGPHVEQTLGVPGTKAAPKKASSSTEKAS